MGFIDKVKSMFGGDKESATETAKGPEPAVTPAEAAEGAPAAGAGQRRYTVQPGDTLWKIAEDVYGDGSKYMKIFEANKPILEDPDKIFPEQELIIPDLED